MGEGEIFAFLGPNGAGKTTAIRMFTTLLKPTSGEIRINNYDPAKDSLKVRSSFGIVFQDPSLDDDLTAEENMEYHGICYGLERKETKARTEEMLRFVSLWDKRKNLVKTFSGGMKRRLEVARGLMHFPTILFLDEPTLGLDPQTRNHIWDYIKKLNKERGLTVFFTTHYMEEAELYADCIAIIDHGKIVAKGSPDELKQKTNTKKLEQASLKLTGYDIRDEQASNLDRLREQQKAWKR